jgi:hypothetical protein
VGAIHLWVDDRLAFRRPEDTKVTAVMTGENPAASLEARAALAGGKVLQEIRVGLRRDDREFFFTLKGPGDASCGAEGAAGGVRRCTRPGHRGGAVRPRCSSTRRSASSSPAAPQVRGRPGVDRVAATGAAGDPPWMTWRPEA